MEFEYVCIDERPPGTENDVCLIVDVNGDGLNDVIIGGKTGRDNIVWYEAPTWERHTIGTARFEAGGLTADIAGNGRPDLVAGSDWGHNELWWFENPGPPFEHWPMRLIDDSLRKYHDQALGDVDGDGEDELIVLSQQSRVIVYYDIPEDPTVSPWPAACRHTIAEDLEVEGVAVVDLDGDGQQEIVAGPYWFKRTGGGWQRHPIAPDYVLTCVAVGDLDGDGRPEVVLCEGESDPARLTWFSNFPHWQPHPLRDDLFHPHSLQIADMTGDGRLDIFVAEMGLGKNERPRMLIYVNNGDGTFEEVLVDDTHPTHHAKVGMIGGARLPSIVGKPYHPESRVEMWINKG